MKEDRRSFEREAVLVLFVDGFSPCTFYADDWHWCRSASRLSAVLTPPSGFMLYPCWFAGRDPHSCARGFRRKFTRSGVVDFERTTLQRESYARFPTIFRLLRQWKFRPFVLTWPHRVNAQDVRDTFLKADPYGNDFWFASLPDLDPIVHRSGARSTAVRDEGARMASIVQDIIAHFTRFRPTRWLVFGDHGYERVHQWVDLSVPLNAELSLRPSDYIIDATVCRIRSALPSEVARTLLSKLHGVESCQTTPPWPAAFGRTFLWAKRGVMFSPNGIDQAEKFVEMHGYGQSSSRSRSLMLTNFAPMGTEIMKPESLRFVFKWIVSACGRKVRP